MVISDGDALDLFCFLGLFYRKKVCQAALQPWPEYPQPKSTKTCLAQAKEVPFASPKTDSGGKILSKEIS